MNGPLLFSVLVTVLVVIVFIAVWRAVRTQDPIEARLQQYGVGDQWGVGADDDSHTASRRPTWSGINRLLAGFGLGPRLATALAGADLPVTAAEFTLIILGAGLLAFLIATVRLGLVWGLALTPLCAYLPIVYMGFRQRRRQRAFTEQLPDLLTLLVGGLRAGHGLSQAMEMIIEQMGPPASTEFGRVARAVELGLPVQRALGDMAERVGIDDLDLVITAINVQYEMGGNLAQTLDVIAETVRDRIRMMREIRVLTAQQRFTGYVLAVLPIAVGVGIYALNTEYMSRLFEPGWIRLLPLAALLMQVAGFVVIRRIVDIEV
jgi:tight adherence protein B